MPTDKKINHMSVHVISRKKGDLEKNDMIYSILKSQEEEYISR